MPPKRRRRFQGLYYHSSPPKVIPMNAQIVNGRKRRDTDDFSVKLSTIRIWMHEKDIGKLTRLLWAGQGHRLCQQASTNSKVKRFLAAVPYVMNSIKDVHQAVIDNSLETLQAKVEPPVPPSLITCKDANGLNIVHKAAGLGHAMILEYLIGVWPDGINETDITGKTPLHWAASAKNNMRCYTLLTQAGADEEALDYKMRTPSYYRHKPHEIERAFLVYLPEAPRVSPGISTDWEALAEDEADGKKLEIKIPDANGFEHDAGADNDISQDDLSDAELNDGKNNNESQPDGETPKENGNIESENVPVETELYQDEHETVIDATEDDNNSEQNNSGRGRGSGSGSGRGSRSGSGTGRSGGGGEGGSNNNGGGGSLNEEDSNTEKEEMKSEDIHTHNGNASNIEDDKVEETDVIQDVEISEEEEKKPGDGKADEEPNSELLYDQQDDDGKDEVKENGEELSDNDIKEPEENAEEQPKLEVNGDNGEGDSNKKKVIEDENVELNVDDEDANADNEENNEGSDTKVNDENEENHNVDDDYDNDKQQKLENVEENDVNDNNDEQDDEQDEHNDPNETDKTENSDTEYPEDNQVINIENDNEGIITNDNNLDDDHKISEKDNDGENTDTDNNVIKKDNENKSDEDENSALLVIENHSNVTTMKQKSINDAEEDDDEDVVVPNTASKFDVNHNEQKSTNGDIDGDGDGGGGEADSHTSSLAIEGFVHGDSEDNTVQSQSAALIDEEPNIQGIIAAGDMEQLAQIVLNGDGAKLLNLESTESDIQAFLNNVPNYMSKIRRVHEAARTGSLLALQQALDRRKFAIAKDEISPGGATPLHVAVLFGHTDIVRYLAARFSETNSITDNDGRTALHYAATIRDNGHFYNLLTQLGADPKLPDNLGYTPEFYTDMDKAKDILTYNKLLRNFGAEELEEELLTDQGQIETSEVSSLSNPIFKTEQGKYLASTLADPLIKALTEIAHKRPTDPVSFLANFLQNYNKNSSDTKTSSDETSSTVTVNHSVAPMRSMHKNLRAAENNNDDSVIELANGDAEEELITPQQDDRDEHGQSMLHFACARSHRRGGLMHLIEESNIDITYRDELYRTARDVSLQANQPANAKEIDRYVLSLAVVGDLRPFQHFALSGYDHILDITDDNGKDIMDIVSDRGHEELADFMKNLRHLEETREELHQMIRELKLDRIRDILDTSQAQWLLKAKNYYGRCALHIAILKESEEIVEYLINLNSDILKIGDNLERTALHYAMGTNVIESLSRILIQNGAKRTSKDLKGRQPSYYFMNKADILRLQEEEEETR